MSRFITSLLILFCLSTLVSSVKVTVFTKKFSPFSQPIENPPDPRIESEGFSIDYVEELSRRLYGANLEFEVINLAGNQEIFDALLNATDTTNHTHLGTAGISITAEREKFLNFLQAFFQSGFQVLVHTINTFSSVASRVVGRFFLAIILILLGLVVIISIATPLAWFAEMVFCPEDKIPIFIDWPTRMENVQWILEEELWSLPFSGRYIYIPHRPLDVTTLRIMLPEIWRALIWVASRLGGVEVSRPHSKVARALYSLFGGVYKIILLAAIASVSAVVAVSSQTTTINGYKDLRGKTICTVDGSTSETYLRENNLGFSIYVSESIDEMTDAFWNGKCDAIVYDWPTLREAVRKRQEETGETDGVIVGPVFNKESYGIATKPGNPWFEQLQQTVIALNADHTKIQEFENKWLADIEGVTGKRSFDIPTWLKVVPAVLGIGLLLVAVVWLYRHYLDKSTHFIQLRVERTDMDYTDDYPRLRELETGSDRYIMGTGEKVDIIFSKIIRILRILYEQRIKEEHGLTRLKSLERPWMPKLPEDPDVPDIRIE